MTTVSGASGRPLSAHSHIGTLVFMVFHMQLSAISLDSWVPLYVCVCVCVCVPDYIRALCPTSSPPVVWAAVSSWASAPESEIRVRLQSVPLPPLLMLQATERAAGSPAATQIQPAKARTQARGRQSATVCHFNPHAPRGGYWREGPWRERKRAPRGRGIFLWHVNNDPRVWKPYCCWLNVCC